MSREAQYITEVRTHTRDLWNALNALVAKQREWNALDYGNTLDDGIGDNAGVTRAMIGAAVFDAANAIVTTLNAGHATNLAKLL